jgi:hypothetical protein
MNPMFKREQCGADARAQFDRRVFGMTKDLVPTDPYVRLMIDVEALKGDAPIIIPSGPPPARPGGPPPGRRVEALATRSKSGIDTLKWSSEHEHSELRSAT